MSLLSRFDTPASLRDVPIDSPFYAKWSNYLNRLIGAEDEPHAGDNGSAFYNPTTTRVNVAGQKALTWMGFPRSLMLEFRDDKRSAFVEAERDIQTRSRQNEYFEWRVDKHDNKITKITFVTEFRKYYEELWKVDRGAVVNIYQDLVSTVVKETDLQDENGEYDIYNRWNTIDGIVHYIQGINTAKDAVDLSIGSINSGQPGPDNYRATPISANWPTSADPRVSYDINMLARKGLYITLRDPIGLYIADWDNSGITTPDGSPAPPEWWQIKRGKPGMVLRVEYEVPPEYGFVVGDLKIGGRQIEFGGQLAEHMTVAIHGLAGHRSGRGMV